MHFGLVLFVISTLFLMVVKHVFAITELALFDFAQKKMHYQLKVG